MTTYFSDSPCVHFSCLVILFHMCDNSDTSHSHHTSKQTIMVEIMHVELGNLPCSIACHRWPTTIGYDPGHFANHYDYCGDGHGQYASPPRQKHHRQQQSDIDVGPKIIVRIFLPGLIATRDLQLASSSALRL